MSEPDTIPDRNAALNGAASVFDVVRLRPLLHFRALVAELGGDAEGLLAQAGVSGKAADGREPVLSYRQLVGLLAQAAQDLGCPDFGMRLAARQGGAALFGALGLAMRSARSLGDAFAVVSTYSHAHSPAAGIWLKPSHDEGETLIGHDILVEGLAGKAQAVEMMFLSGSLSIAEITGGLVRPRRVLFRHQAMASRADYRRLFQCEVRFGQFADALVFADEDLQCPLPASNAGHFRAAVEYIEARYANRTSPYHARVRGILTHFIPTGLCSKEKVAQELGLHPRTMHRRLAGEGTSLQRIKDEVRRDFLLYYLRETDLDLTRISAALGFAEQSVLTRFCHKWFACSPTHLRAGGQV